MASRVWERARVVVVDTETTGVTPGSRILSIAMKEVHAGEVVAAYASPVNPNLPVIGATEIHGITNAMLREVRAPAFAGIVDTVQRWLEPRGAKAVILVGFNVTFDAKRLYEEFAHLGRTLPPGLLLLKVETLAARLGIAASNLETLAKSLEISQDHPHRAESDARTAAAALIEMVARLAQKEPRVRLIDLATPFDPSVQETRAGRIRSTAQPAPPLSAAHAVAHVADLTRKQSREHALAVCLDEDCEDLASRCAEAVGGKRQAAEVLDWIWRQLDHTPMGRPARGRLLSALARVATMTQDPARIRAEFEKVSERLSTWGACRAKQRCDRCADPGRDRLCRFRSVRYKLLDAFMREQGELSVQRAHEFFPFTPGAKRVRGRQPTGWFGQLMRAGDLDAAGFGAHLVAQTGASSRKIGWERAVLERAWALGARNAKLADRYSALILTDGSDDPRRPHLTDALAVIRAALRDRGTDRGRLWGRITDRRDTILARQKAPPRPKPASVRNRRPPRPNRFVLAG